MGYNTLFDYLIDAPSIGGYKPSPLVFSTTLDIIGSKLQDCLMIGDRPERDGGSEKVGFKTLLFSKNLTSFCSILLDGLYMRIHVWIPVRANTLCILLF